MSTKTSFKRIALVAASALAIAGFSAVPSQAAVTTARALFVDNTASTTYDDASQTVKGGIGVAAVAKIAITTTTEADTTEVISVTPTIVSSPSGSTVTVGAAGAAKVGMTTTNYDSSAAMNTTPANSKWTLATSDGVNTLTFNAVAGPALAAKAVGQLSLTADIAGTYVIDVTPSSSTGTGATNTKVTVTFVIQNLYVTTADGLTSGTQSDITANGVAGAYNTVTLNFRTTASASRLIAVSGSTINSAAAPSGGTSVVSVDKTNVVITDDGTAEDVAITIATPSVGTITVKSYATSQGGIFSTTANGTVTITVNAAAQTGLISATTSTAVMTASGTGTLSTDALSLTGASTASSTIGSIAVTLTPVTGSCSATNVATISTTKGLLTVSSGATNGTGASLAEIGDCAFNVAIKGDGTTGAATVTITSGAYTATRTITFFGSASKIVATQVLMRASTAGAALGATSSAAAAAVTLAVTDSTGNPVSGVTPLAVSSDTTVLASGLCSASTSKGASYCSVTSAANLAGKTASVTFKTTVSGVDIISNAITFTLGGALATYKWAFDKASYSPGEKMTINITGSDSKANASFDGDVDIFDTAITTSTPVTYSSTDDLVGITFVDGKGSMEIYAPLVAGPFSITAGVATGLATAMGATSVTLSTEVEGDATASLALDAANAATDAANNAYDEAQNATQAASDALAAVTALAAQVKSLIASVKKLTAAVAKLKK